MSQSYRQAKLVHGMTLPEWLSPKVKLHRKARLLSSKCQQTQLERRYTSVAVALQDSILVAGYPLGGDSLSITKGIVSWVFPAAHLPNLDPMMIHSLLHILL